MEKKTGFFLHIDLTVPVPVQEKIRHREIQLSRINYLPVTIGRTLHGSKIQLNQRAGAEGVTVMVLPNGIKIPEVGGGLSNTARAPSLIATELTKVVMIKSA